MDGEVDLADIASVFENKDDVAIITSEIFRSTPDSTKDTFLKTLLKYHRDSLLERSRKLRAQYEVAERDANKTEIKSLIEEMTAIERKKMKFLEYSKDIDKFEEDLQAIKK